MSTIQFRIHLSAQQVVEEPIDIQEPVYRVVSALKHRHQLPTVEGDYGLFGGPERRPLSREASLGCTAYANGGELYLAPAHTPWWALAPTTPPPAPSGAARPITRGIPARSQFSMTPKTAALALVGVIGVALFGLLFWPQPAPGVSSGQELTLLAPSAMVAAPTATLLPATPTPDLATQARNNYQEGMSAYAAENWALAADRFQQVYAYDASYSEVRSVLAATFYNWGIALRDSSDVAGAQAHFQSTLEIDGEHALAQQEQSKASLFLEAQAAAGSGDQAGAVERYQRVNAMHGGDYAGATTQIYELLIAQATALAERGGSDSLRQAYRLYSEAASLDLGDRSQAQQAMLEIERLLPTPTPPRPTATAVPARLRFAVANYNDDPSCISIGISGITPAGWHFVVDSIGSVSGRFDGGGNARACGLAPGQEVTITVFDGNGQRVAGGGGVPSRGSAIMVASWR